MINDAALRIDLVGAETFLGQQAIDHRIGKSGGVAAGLPDFGVHDDGGLQADDIIAPLGHDAPPVILDVALEFRAQRAVIPKAVDAAVNFGGLENKPLRLHKETIRSIKSLALGSTIVMKCPAGPAGSQDARTASTGVMRGFALESKKITITITITSRSRKRKRIGRIFRLCVGGGLMADWADGTN